jgi:hypothetical protein
MEKIGIGLGPFHPIINATLKNIEEKGPVMSLTGPVIRGDAGTVADHLRAMEGMESQEKIYRTLSLAALEMARRETSSTPGSSQASKSCSKAETEQKCNPAGQGRDCIVYIRITI